jgi:predicted nucleic acid-binding protein
VSTYFDTSYLVALYVPNDHTVAALRHHSRHSREPLLFTPLHRLELRTVVRQCAYTGLISEPSARAILRHIDEDLDDGTLLHQPLKWTESLRQTEIIASRRAMKMPCRSLDLWHVAAAIEIGARDFVTFDQDQFDLAQAEGLDGTMPR